MLFNFGVLLICFWKGIYLYYTVVDILLPGVLRHGYWAADEALPVFRDGLNEFRQSVCYCFSVGF